MVLLYCSFCVPGPVDRRLAKTLRDYSQKYAAKVSKEAGPLKSKLLKAHYTKIWHLLVVEFGHDGRHFVLVCLQELSSHTHSQHKKLVRLGRLTPREGSTRCTSLNITLT